MRHSGISGYALEMRGNSIRKWTMGKDVRKKLQADAMKQMRDMIEMQLWPLVPVEISAFRVVEHEEFFMFEMPYLKYDSGFTVKSNITKIKSQIRESLNFRIENENPGFRDIIRLELERIRSEFTDQDRIDGCSTILKIYALLDRCGSFYPQGFCHGDFGFENMLINEYGKIHMIDFTHSFIETALMDVAALELSLIGGTGQKWHFDLCALIRQDMHIYADQIDLLKLIRMLSWLPKATEKTWRLQLIELLNK